MKSHLFLCFAIAITTLIANAAPQLKSQAELVANGKLKIKVLANAAGVPPPTPEAKIYIITKGDKRETKKVYDENEVAYANELLGMWKDKKGNIMRLAKIGKFPWGENVTHKIKKEINGETYYIDFQFAEKVADQQAKKMLKTAADSLSAKTGGMSANNSSMKWWEHETDRYKFLTDLDKAKGGKFIQDTERLMEAMRKSYELYVPPQKEVGKCTVRIFKTLAGYREYRASTGDRDTMSCGLWDPSREELLIAAENREQAHSTMRHEAFHQYLFYATECGNHAVWFNEGHACFFEEVKYHSAKNTVKILDSGNRAMWVGKNPSRHANAMRSILTMSYRDFYSGDVNLHYCAAWALMYFLEKGSYSSEEFAPYRDVVPTYLKLTAAGEKPEVATERAWAPLANRDLASDFLKFWKDKRKAALATRD